MLWEMLVVAGERYVPVSSGVDGEWRWGGDVGPGCLGTVLRPTSAEWDTLCHRSVPRLVLRHAPFPGRVSLGGSIDYFVADFRAVELQIGAGFLGQFASSSAPSNQMIDLRLDSYCESSLLARVCLAELRRRAVTPRANGRSPPPAASASHRRA